MSMELKAILTLDNSEFKTRIKESSSELERFDGSAKSATTGTTGLSSATGVLTKAMTALGGVIVVDQLAQLATFAVDAYRETEKFAAVLKTATGSADAAADQLNRLREFAAQTPYDLKQAIDGFVMLKNMGLDASIESMISYGNTASAMSKDLSQMIEAVADASNYQFERLVEFGIKTEQEGDKVKFTFQGVTTEVEKSSKSIQQYLLDIGNTNFAGAMEEQANTLNGVLSELKDNATDIAAKFLEQSGAANALKASLSALSGALKSVSSDMGNVTQSPYELLQAVSGGQVDVAIANINSLSAEFGAASNERRAAIRNELLDFYGALKQQQTEYSSAIQSASKWRDGALGGLADKTIEADATRLAANARAMDAINKAFATTGSAMNPAYWDSLEQAQKPVWDTMEAGAKKAASGISSLTSAMGKGGASWLPDVVKYRDEISKAADQFAVDAKLVQAVIMQESIRASKARGVSPETIGSPAGAKGMMQLMPGTAAEMAKELNMTGYSLYNAADNIKLGTAYLSKQLFAFNGDVEKALAAYNAGPGAVSKYGGIPPYKETQNYVKQIMADYNSLTGESEKAEKKRQSAMEKTAKATEVAAKKEADAIRKTEEERKKASEKILADLDAIDLKRIKALATQQLEIDMIGKSAAEQQKIRLLAEGWSPELADKSSAMVVAKRQAELANQLALQRQEALLTTDAFLNMQLVTQDGLTPAMAELQVAGEKQAASLASLREIADKAFQGIGDALLTTAMTGKADWQGLMDSIISETMRLAVIQPFVKSLSDSFLSLSGGGNSGSNGILGSIGSALGLFANGGAFTGQGVQAFANGGAFHNSVLSQPTQFFANGGLAVAGEAGAEAVMPLTRINGKLGVMAQGASQAAPVPVMVQPQINIHIDNRASSATVNTTQERNSDGSITLRMVVDEVESSIADRARRGQGLANVFRTK